VLPPGGGPAGWRAGDPRGGHGTGAGLAVSSVTSGLNALPVSSPRSSPARRRGGSAGSPRRLPGRGIDAGSLPFGVHHAGSHGEPGWLASTALAGPGSLDDPGRDPAGMVIAGYGGHHGRPRRQDRARRPPPVTPPGAASPGERACRWPAGPGAAPGRG
jgi:hypothetical protein